MTKKLLINRWNSKEGKLLLAEIVNCLSKGKNFSNINGLEKHEGRWDLRGATLSIIKRKQSIVAEGYNFSKKTGSLRINNTELKYIDFSFANISYAQFQKTVIKNCIFEETIAREIRLVACQVINCIFERSDLSYSKLGENISKDSGCYTNVRFIETSLKESTFYFPIIEHCTFVDCNLMATNFDGSRLQNCKFIGKVDSPIFNGYSLYAHRAILGIFNRINPKQYPNLMKNIDFSEARLIGVTFKNGIKLSDCLFPESNNYLIVKNIGKVFPIAKQYILHNWDGEDKRIGLHLIERVYYTQSHYEQNMVVIDKYLLLEQFNKKFTDRFFRLIQDAQQ